ncbi:DUF3688 family protein [Spiroplasma endosymbiont of Phyllotreta cruciferae]|uniref:DUF3688 family protein n=1 Tax=Spiroplasma endosymbiont of Phyllotreta cruciferae TaxID=2886375 RepID=UPI0020A0E8A2|nr:DUF3688 family protein [Spiroplasma endosymbiont of Phyllotreta cruciferae]
MKTGGNGNKPEPPYNPQQPPENSSWKLIDTNTSNWISNNEFPSNKNKWYIMFAILENESLLDLRLIKFKNDDINKPQSLDDKSNFIFLNNKKYWFSWLYRWDGTNEPETPTVDKDTSKITNWKE